MDFRKGDKVRFKDDQLIEVAENSLGGLVEVVIPGIPNNGSYSIYADRFELVEAAPVPDPKEPSVGAVVPMVGPLFDETDFYLRLNTGWGWVVSGDLMKLDLSYAEVARRNPTGFFDAVRKYWDEVNS